MRIANGMKVADIFERYPQTHGINLQEFIEALNESLVLEQAPEPIRSNDRGIEDPEVQKILVTKTGDLAGNHPATREVFIRHFGPGCFSCPAFGQEDTAFACSMHNTDAPTFARECLRLIQETKQEEFS